MISMLYAIFAILVNTEYEFIVHTSSATERITQPIQCIWPNAYLKVYCQSGIRPCLLGELTTAHHYSVGIITLQAETAHITNALCWGHTAQDQPHILLPRHTLLLRHWKKPKTTPLLPSAIPTVVYLHIKLVLQSTECSKLMLKHPFTFTPKSKLSRKSILTTTK